MSYVPTILVIGEAGLESDLAGNLARGSCHVRYFDTPQLALDQASEASVVLISARAAGAEDFCRRLRADPITSSIPLLVRGGSHQSAPYADEVLSTDLQHTLDVLYAYLPELLDPHNYQDVPDDDFGDSGELFDINESTVVWRRPEGVDDWPQPPPEYHKGEDPLEYARGYAGYVNSLVEAIEMPDVYGEAQTVRLDEMTHRVVAAMDEVLATIQNAINDALRAGDLQRMRELSAAKNVLFEKLQRLRTLQNSGRKQAGTPASPVAKSSAGPPLGPTGLSGPTGPMTPGPAAELARKVAGPSPLATGPHEPPALDGIPGALGETGPQRKSRLTLAAEAKEAARVRQEKQREVARRAAAPRQGGARAADRRSIFASTTFWLALVGIGVVAGGAVYLLRSEDIGTTRRGDPNNKPPLMRYVTIQETGSGVLARPKAEDAEGDPVTYSIRWTVDGQPIAGIGATLLPPRFYRAGQSVVVEVTPNDPFGSGQPMASQPLAITGRATLAPRR